MKIPTITREAIDTASKSDGAADARRFMDKQPELYQAILERMSSYDIDTCTSFIAGVNFGFRCLEEVKEPD